jgi:5-formyltetrahydrofolate cyclo-ligase
MAGSSISERKTVLRSAALSQRNTLTREDFLALSGLAQTRALEFAPYRRAPAVALYSPIQNEVGTESIREHALKSGKKVFYPKLGGINLVELAQIYSAVDLIRGHLGISEPVAGACGAIPSQDGTVVFVPGLLFDAAGNRLGRGIGWYDRLRKKIGRTAVFAALAYEFQIVVDLPTDSWDEKVDYIITENRLIECGTTTSRTGAVS